MVDVIRAADEIRIEPQPRAKQCHDDASAFASDPCGQRDGQKVKRHDLKLAPCDDVEPTNENAQNRGGNGGMPAGAVKP